jgi:uncharacterized protein involved in type VI secretion and phage assembly
VTIGLYSPKVSLDGSPLTEAQYEILLDVRVIQDLHAPSMATLRLVDPFFDLLDSSTFKLGAKIEIAFPNSAGADTTVFKGTVAAVGSEQGAGDRHELVVSAYDGSQVLTRTVAPISYQEMTVGDIVGKIAKTHGLSPQVKDADAKLDYFLQVDTDYMTLNELAARCGTEWWVDDTKLHFAKRKVESTTKLEWGDNLRRLSARFTAGGHVEEVTVRGWDPATQKAVVGTVKRSAIAAGDTGQEMPIQTDRVSQAKDLKGAIVITELQVASAEEAKAIAQSRLADLSAGELRVKGEAYGTPAVAAGKTVEISKAGKQMSGKFVITRVEHVFGVDRPLVSRFEAGRMGPGGLADRLAAADQTDRQTRRMFAVGTVTNAKDPEKAGRVKVKLPMVSDKDESTWARVVTLGAGKSRGIEFMPDVGDEVVVAFLGNDPRFPVVLGSLWSKKYEPPLADPVKDDKISERMIVAASGAKLTFVEGAGDKDKAVTSLIHAVADTKLIMDKAGIVVEAKKDTKIVIKVGDSQVEMKGDGTINIKGKAITIKADMDVKIQGKNVSIKGDMGVKIDGGAKLDLGPAGAKLESSAITTIKGAMVKLN